jgi:hypothetical protein
MSFTLEATGSFRLPSDKRHLKIVNCNRAYQTAALPVPLPAIDVLTEEDSLHQVLVFAHVISYLTSATAPYDNRVRALYGGG